MRRLILVVVLVVQLLGIGFSINWDVNDGDTIAVNWNSRHAPHGNGHGGGNGNGNGKG